MSGRAASPPVDGNRSALAPWLFLAATDVVTVSTLARCFSGPGELAVVVPTCAACHLLAGGGRRLLRRSGTAPKRLLPLVGALGWLLALGVAFLLPLAVVDGSTFSGLLPLGPTWHVVNGQLQGAWTIFSDRIAPVVEAPGLVLAASWAAGAVALAAEVLYADAGLPAVLSLVPAFDVIVFVGTLGTSTGRAAELALVAASALAFLLTSQRDRRARRMVVMARSAADDHAPGQPRGNGGAASLPELGWALPALALVAAVAAGVGGPLLPGATSAPLIAWHGLKAGRHGVGGTGVGTNAKPNHVFVSDLVQVAEQEIDNSNGLLFTVHSAVRTREVLLTLDRFNGNAWSRGTGQSTAVPQFSTSLQSIERHPPAPLPLVGGGKVVEQVVDISTLGGRFLPSPGVTSAVDGLSEVSELGHGGPLVSPQELTAHLSYGLKAVLPPSSPSTLRSAFPFGSAPPPVDLSLPGPVPARIVHLARSIAAGTGGNPYLTALRLQDYFLSGHGFVYHLPSVTPTGAIADTSQSYKALESFLFGSRTGYCQQFATAFAVLGRIDGLATRVAVGFLPGKEVAPDTYTVTGAEVHAWPEVFMSPFGWVGFEPTPGTPLASGKGTKGPGTTTPGGGSTVPTSSLAIKSNFGRIRPGGAKAGTPPTKHHPAAQPAARQVGSSDAADVALGLVGLGVVWAGGVPTWRLRRRRRDRREARRAIGEAWASAGWLLAIAGAHRRRAETHLEFADRVRRLGILTPDACDALGRLATRMDRLWYAPVEAGGASAVEAAAAWADAATIRRAAKRRIAWWQRLALVVDPRDLLRTS